MIFLLQATALVFALFSTIATAVHPVEVQGQDFVDTVTKKRVMIIGVDYQPGGQAGYKPTEQKDALTNGTVCLRDAALLQRLGVNTIRIYNIDPTLNHDECASIFNAVGIYMILDVNSPLGGESIDRSNPSSSYNEGYLTRIFGIVENFKGYPNTLGFFSGNEVMNDVPSAKDNPPYIRAVTRDLRNYIAKHSDRTIPVGYSAADVREILQDQWEYLQCAIDGNKDDPTRSEFFGLNSYSWCGSQSNFQTAQYDVLANMFGKSSIPIFFSEYGCNKELPRVFNEVEALYGKQMTALSGGLVYEYSLEEANYGLVKINANSTVSLLQDYDNLQKQYNALDINLLQSIAPDNAQVTIPKCSSDLISDAGLSKSFDIPEPPSGGEDLINNGIDNPVQGKLVQVKDTKVPMAVYGSTGVQVQDLAIKPLANDESNLPGGETTSPTSSQDGTQPSKSSDKPGGASTFSVYNGASLYLMLALALTMF